MADTPLRIYIAGPYTAKRTQCRSCPQLTITDERTLYCKRHMALRMNAMAAALPGCTEPDVERRDANVDAADEAGREIARRGHIPFVPHKMTQDWERDKALAYEDFMRIDIAWLRMCDALLYLAPSPGADRELELAKTLGLTIYYSVDEIPEVPDDTRRRPR